MLHQSGNSAHELTDEQLGETLLDLLAAALDEQVCGSCQTEVYRALEAVVDAMSFGYYQNRKNISSLVEHVCDPAARGLESRMRFLSVVLVARNVPYMRSPRQGEGVGSTNNDGGSENGTDKGPSLRHEVCHRLLTEGFLKDTSYKTEECPPGFGRALKAMDVVLDDEDNILEDDSFEGYERQFGVVALVNEMVAGALAVSENGQPESSEECQQLLHMVDRMNRQLRDVMQRPVQMCKTLLDLMKSKLEQYVKETGRQGTLSSFVRTGTANEDEEEQEEEEEEDEEEEQEDSAGEEDQETTQPKSQSQSQSQ